MAVNHNITHTIKETASDGTILISETRVLEPSLAEAQSQYYDVPPETVDMAIGFGSIAAASLVMLYSDQPLTVKINGELTGRPVTTLVWNGANITSLSVSNSGAIKATLRVHLSGV